MSQYDGDGFDDFPAFEDMDPTTQAAMDASLIDLEEARSEEYCPRCGKEFTEWGDLGCEYCDARVRSGSESGEQLRTGSAE